MTFSEKLKETRKQAGISQEQLAEKLCISRSAIAKWENDLGHPDIENLRAMAQLFNLSMDALTDDTLSLEDAARTSAPTCCGKSCEGCTHRNALDCPGCRKLDHHGVDGCAIARCCQCKRLDSCNDCNYRKTCNMLRGREYIPSKRLTAINTHKAQQDAITKRNTAYASWLANAYPILHKWMPLLFWVYLAPFISGLLGLIPALTKPADLVSSLLPFGYVLLLWKLSPVHSHYKKASLFYLISVAVGLLSALLILPRAEAAAQAVTEAIRQNLENALPGQLVPNGEYIDQLTQEYQSARLLSLAVGLLSAALLIPSAYFECHAHAAILESFHPTLAKEWLRVWKLVSFVSGGLLTLVLVMLFLPFPVLLKLFVLALLCLTLSGFAMIFLRWRALFRLSKYFRSTTAEEIIRGADTNVPIPS